MSSSKFILDLTLILVTTKIFGLITRKFKTSHVLGAILAGLFLGPSFLNIVKSSNVINNIAELGVIILMFVAGLETNLKKFKSNSKSALTTALSGAIFPLSLSILFAKLFQNSLGMSEIEIIFIGVILSATSVSISVKTLEEIGKLKSKAGLGILSAAIIDDIISIILLTLIISFTQNNSSLIILTLFKILAFFAFAIITGIIFYYFFQWFSKYEGKKRRIPIFALSLCFFLSYLSELFGIADIIGSYIAGLILCNTIQSHYIERKMEILSYMFFSPIFFANIGLKMDFSHISKPMLFFTLLLAIVAILSKVFGAGLGAKLSGFSKKTSLVIGVGMIARGEVALIVANRGRDLKFISENTFNSLILIVTITTLITPILLNLIYKKRQS